MVKRFAGKREGFFVEIGALDGEMFSNTYLLEKSLNWTGILIEADPRQAARCRQCRPASVTVSKAVTSPQDAGKSVRLNVVDGFNALSTLEVKDFTRKLIDKKNALGGQLSVSSLEVDTVTIDEALETAGAPADIDFVSIDIEGQERAALRGFALGSRWHPRVLLIENSSVLPDLWVSTRVGRAGYAYKRSVASINDWYEPSSRRAVAFGFARQSSQAAPVALRRGVGLALRRLGLESRFRALIYRLGKPDGRSFGASRSKRDRWLGPGG